MEEYKFKTQNQHNIDLLTELRRKVDITYRIRILSVDRLRRKDKFYKKLNIYYSALVTSISIISFKTDTTLFNFISVSGIALISSIILTYFMLYVSNENLQERAYKMEETFKALGTLRDKIDITLCYQNNSYLSENDCKKFHKQYEAILLNIENHESIDYDIYKLNNYTKKSSSIDPCNIADFKSTRLRVLKNNIHHFIIKWSAYLLPLLFVLYILFKIYSNIAG